MEKDKKESEIFPRTHEKTCHTCGVPFKCRFTKHTPFYCSISDHSKECICPTCLMRRVNEEYAVFTLKGAVCLGEVRSESWQTRGFLFMMEGHLLFLETAGFSLEFEEKSHLVRLTNQQNAVFLKIAKTRYFEEHGSYWTVHNEAEMDE